ncbi:MAG: ABC transporter ATP-binding protein [Candidatus Limnocylindria bacterium]|nr:ABC transporter ATP-binding protein [Candidatus Limnocylindria bacterium]
MSVHVAAPTQPLLEAVRLSTGYGGLQVLWDVDLEIRPGEAVALIGANGAGKTTLLRALAGLLPVWSGSTRLEGQDLRTVPMHRRVARGIVVVPEGRQMFAGLTVRENLLMGAYGRDDRLAISADLERMERLFPVLAERRRQLAGLLSGGEQQMCAIARALMARPRVLLVDELSLGLAPVIVDRLVEALREVHDAGVALLVVEQDVAVALGLAERAYVLENGRIALSGRAGDLALDPRVREAFMGI